MSDQPPPNPSSALIPTHYQHLSHHHHHQQQQQPPPITTTNIPPTTTTTTTPTPSPNTTSQLNREYRKGNWTVHETLVLITAKKMDEERRTKTSSSSSTVAAASGSCRTAELRWKWVENYCWKNGCMRSQNQCNDKWDNLLRDYKKVREYESRSDGSQNFPSYWQIEKHQRKERNLPTNLLSEIYHALNEVVHRRYQQPPKTSYQPSNLIITSTPPTIPPPPQPALPPPPSPPSPPPPVEMSDSSSQTEGSERLDSNTKRRRKSSKLRSSIVKSGSVLVKTLVECEENNEKRHKQLIELEERRLQIEETRNEVNKQGFATLISAINELSSSIQALVSHPQE